LFPRSFGRGRGSVSPTCPTAFVARRNPIGKCRPATRKGVGEQRTHAQPRVSDPQASMPDCCVTNTGEKRSEIKAQSRLDLDMKAVSEMIRRLAANTAAWMNGFCEIPWPKNLLVRTVPLSRLFTPSSQRMMNTSYAAHAARYSRPCRSSGASLNLTSCLRDRP
jgi:hypothetical protein